MFKDSLFSLRLVWFLSLFLAAFLALPSLLAGQWFEAVAKFLLILSLMLVGLKLVLFLAGRKAAADPPDSAE